MNVKNIRHKILPKRFIPLADELYRKSRLGFAHARYGVPARGLKIIAITGTNGKTSTCNFLNDMLKTAGYTTAMFTTAVIEINGERSINKTHRTVPLTSELFGFLLKARAMQADFVILETTSHALHQHKLWGIPIEVAIMTNLSQDHLDYHGTMQKYAESKARLFNSYLNPKKCVLNTDDEWFDFYKKQAVGTVWTYGKDKRADLKISSYSGSAVGIKVRFDSGNTSIVALSPVIGEFNAYNLAAAASACYLLDIEPDVIRRGLESIAQVPGRMEIITSSKGFGIVVDYAHTPDALEKALKALNEAAKGKVSVVFGATGNRDTSKRPVMGEVAARYADYIYLTDDETYTENGAQIRMSVMEGIKNAGGEHKTTEIADRYQAIKSAVVAAKKNDIILVAGLGHQDYRAMNEGNIPWQETEVVKKILSEVRSR